MSTRVKILIAAGVVLALLTAITLLKYNIRVKVEPRKGKAAQRHAEVRAKKALAPAALPAVIKKAKAPAVAIVMDDLGYGISELNEILAIKEPITFSILPNLQFSKKIANIANSSNYEVILHLPMESERKDVKEEAGTIKSTMPEKEVIDTLDRDIASVPNLKGISNHMGSKATEDSSLMSLIMGELKRRGLFFFDSVTGKTVCREVAHSVGIPYARRDIFLDNSNDIAKIDTELSDLEKLAFKKGRAIGICHYRKNTIKALEKMMPAMADDGVQFVFLSDMVN